MGSREGGGGGGNPRCKVWSLGLGSPELGVQDVWVKAEV